MAKTKPSKFSATQGLLAQCRQMPGQLRSVCEQAARTRYARHYHPSNPYRRRHVIVDMVMAIGLVFSLAAVAFITLIYQRSVQHQQIEVAITSERSAVASGDIAEVHIEVRNNGRQSLQNASLSFPESTGFVITDAVPPLGTIKGNDRVSVTVKALVIGEIGSAVRINSVLSYTSSLGTNEQTIASQALLISGSQLSVDLEIPESLALGKAFPFTITVHNQSEASAFENVLLTPNFPPSWETLESSVPLDPATSVWTIDRIGSLQYLVITGQARLLTATADTVPVGLKIYAAPYGAPYLQDESRLDIPVFAPKVTAKLMAVPPFVQVGENTQVTVEIRNTEAVALEQVRLDIHIPETLIVAERSNGVWAFPMNNIAANETMRVDIPLVLVQSINPELVFGANPVVLPWIAELHFMREGQLVTVPFDRVDIPFASDLAMQASSRYTSAEGEAIGTGPWPPRVGEATTVWVFLHPSNRFNDVNQVAISGRLGEGVRFTGRQSVTGGSAITVDAVGNMRWDIGSVGNYTAIASDQINAAMELELVPTTEEQVNSMILLSDIRIRGIDSQTQTTLSAHVEPITVSTVLNGR